MNRYCRPRGLAALFMLLSVGACSRPTAWQAGDHPAQADQHPVPFHDGDEAAPANSSEGNAPPTHQAGNPETRLPFSDPENLPAGTLLTVRLRNPISTDMLGARETFDAVVDEAVTVEGTMLIPRGATVAGRVESARASKAKTNRGYVRLTLASIDIAGRELPIQTSSLFARDEAGNANAPESDASGGGISLEKGRRLTFRLTEPAYVAHQRAIPGH
jgi:hypothetical protein